jgi:hypothetical protein
MYHVLRRFLPGVALVVLFVPPIHAQANTSPRDSTRTDVAHQADVLA